MQIQQVQMERFGRHEHLILDSLTAGLNVIFGPEGSGKSTAAECIRWLLYGHADRASGGDSPPPVANMARSSAGSLTFLEAGRRRFLSRHDDGSLQGRLMLDGDDYYGEPSQHLLSLVGNILPRDFDRLYSPAPADEYGLLELLQASAAQGIEFTSHRVPSLRWQEVRSQIDDARRDLERLPWVGTELSGLFERKRQLEQIIDKLAAERQRGRLDEDREYQDLSQRIREIESDIDRLRKTWHDREREVNDRRRELELTWARAEDARRDYLSHRRAELADIENHLSHARRMHSDLQRRQMDLEAQLRASDLQLDRSPQERDQAVCLVQSIARQLDDLRGGESASTFRDGDEYYQWGAAAARHATFRYRGSGSPLRAALESLRDEVGRLCDTLQKEHSQDRVRDIADELDQLRQTEEAMHRWMMGLDTRQARMASDLTEVERHGVALVVDRDADRAVDRRDWIDSQSALPLRAVRHSCDDFAPIHPDQDPLWRQWCRARDAALRDLQACEQQLSQLIDRRRDVEARWSRNVDWELQAARRELAEIESRYGAAEERERLQRRITQLEFELDQLESDVRPAPVVEHAARILARLTQGRYQNLRVEGTTSLAAADASGTFYPSARLSHDDRQQLYLSICLAVITSFRRRGIQLPFLLLDDRLGGGRKFDSALAHVLRAFAEMGQQVFVFTSHPHVVRMLQEVGANVVELARKQNPVPHRPEVVEQVRFRSRTEPRYPSASFDSFRGARHHDAGPEWPTVRPLPPVDDLELAADRSRRSYRPSPRAEQAPVTSSWLDQRPGYYENVTFENDPPATAAGGPFVAPPAPPRPQALHRNPPSRAEASDAMPLSPATRIEHCGTIEADVASRLRAVGIVTVGDFVDASPATIDTHLQDWGFESLPVRRWQVQLRLRGEVAGISADDARLLVAVGIESAESLANADVDSLSERIGRLLSTSRAHAGGRYDALRRDYHRERISRWIHAAREALPSRRTARSERTHGSSHRASLGKPERRLARETSSVDRFYLQRNDPVVDAPTIGPRTAERLGRLGIDTVGDLLQADPEELAASVHSRRISADDIRDWQLQATLVCRVPGLRGHDARVLVACGVMSAEHLAASSADELWGTIRPFTKTNECKRIIRNGKMPDRQEVADWIRAVQSARSLQKA